jgi:MFS family permease
VLLAPVSGKLSDRVGSRWLIAFGTATIGVALVLLARLGVHDGLAEIAPPLFLGGFGMVFVMSPTRAAALGAVPAAKSGIGAGVLTTFGQAGGSLAIATMGAILAAEERHSIGRGAARSAAFVHGMHTVYAVSAGIAFTAAAIAVAAIRRPQLEEPAIADLQAHRPGLSSATPVE